MGRIMESDIRGVNGCGCEYMWGVKDGGRRIAWGEYMWGVKYGTNILNAKGCEVNIWG